MTNRRADRRRATDEFLQAAVSSLSALTALNAIYDSGNLSIAREMANVLARLFDNELPQCMKMKDLYLRSYAFRADPENMMAQALIQILEVNVSTNGAPALVDGSNIIVTAKHIPLIFTANEGEISQELQDMPLRFFMWWKSDVLIAGAADGPLIPIDQAQRVPFAKRRRISREEVIRSVRNRLAAHYDRTVPGDVWLLEDPLFIENFAMKCGEVDISLETHPKQFRITNHPLHAMLRHISEEVTGSLSGKLEKQPV